MRFPLTAKSAIAMVALTALPLAACQADLEEPNLDLDTAASSPQDAPTETETVTEQAETEYVDVDPERFKTGSAYIVGGASGVPGCMAKPGQGYPFNCYVSFADPVPPAENPDGVKLGFPPNIASYDEPSGRFRPEFSPGSQGYATTPTPLAKGERTTIDGATMTHLHNGGFRVDYKGAWFEVHDGVFTASKGAQNDEPATQIEEAAAPQGPARGTGRTASKGEKCGEWNLHGETMGVYAVEDGTTCHQGMDAIEAYFAAAERGEMQGTVTAWTNPASGWGCTGRYLLPGDSDEPSNRRIACTDTQLDGTKAHLGTGGVVLLTDADAARL